MLYVHCTYKETWSSPLAPPTGFSFPVSQALFFVFFFLQDKLYYPALSRMFFQHKKFTFSLCYTSILKSIFFFHVVTLLPESRFRIRAGRVPSFLLQLIENIESRTQ